MRLVAALLSLLALAWWALTVGSSDMPSRSGEW